MGISSPPGPMALKALQYAATVVTKLNELCELERRQIALQKAYPLMFRAQAAVHETVLCPQRVSTKICEANPKRKGLRIDWRGTHDGGCYLGLGQNASPSGIFLNTTTGNTTWWDGRVGDALWTGEVYAYPAHASSVNIDPLNVTEIA